MTTTVRRKDISFEPIKGGIGAGGQHRDKNATGVRATHKTTGIVVVIRSRSLAQSKRRAVEEIRRRVRLEQKKAGDRHRKARWRAAIRERNTIRTYHYPRQTVTDHRTGAEQSLRKTLDGDLDIFYLAFLKAQRDAKRKEMEDVAAEIEE